MRIVQNPHVPECFLRLYGANLVLMCSEPASDVAVRSSGYHACSVWFQSLCERNDASVSSAADAVHGVLACTTNSGGRTVQLEPGLDLRESAC